MSAKLKKFKIADSYMELIHQFPLRPIRNEAEYDIATAIAEKLYVREEDDLNAGERDYLDALDEFIGKYDDQHYSLGKAEQSPLERLKYILVESGTTPAKLKEILGCSQPLVSMILSGSRELSKDNIKSLARHFGVRGDLFL